MHVMTLQERPRAETPGQDMASVLWSMADARYRQQRLLDEYIRSLSMGSNVKAQGEPLV